MKAAPLSEDARRFVSYLREAPFAWLRGDPIPVTGNTLLVLERRRWVTLERWKRRIVAARLTPIGRAAACWGDCRVF